ncbi:MAG: hypothetical protein JW873_05750 [Candidatus Saganbacteria bacterium]|nr:hypothetical protein [Candidatus Saganbacteria bacterium]
MGMEGSPEEIKGLCLNLGFNKDELLDIGEEVNIIWLAIPVMLFIICSVLLRLNILVPYKEITIILEFLIILWIAAAVQIRHKSFWVTGLCIAILSIVMGYCLDFFNALQIISKLIKLR